MLPSIKRRVLLLAFICFISINLIFEYLGTHPLDIERFQQVSNQVLRQDQMVEQKRATDIPFILVICGKCIICVSAVKAQVINSKTRDIFIFSTVKFILVTSSNDTYDHITAIVASWPHQYQQKLDLTHSPVWYPSTLESKMRGIYRQCATEDIFLPDMFPNLDAAIFVDTDMVFLRAPEHLWQEFELFTDHEMVGMVPCRTNSSKTLDFKCWNAGLILFNITRLRDFPGGWTQANVEVLDHHSHGLGDQDILNVVFKENPEYLHEVSCEWNYRRTQCQEGFNECPQAALRGISSLHGNAYTFMQDPLMKEVYLGLQKHNLHTSNFSATLNELQEKVKVIIKEGKPGYKFWCANATGIESVFLQQLHNHLPTINH
ncbi:unnamed protein product, partial [Meganyctiphanes norvegica]